jgi:2-hydroxychromene-2-carboxylate isomerase
MGDVVPLTPRRRPRPSAPGAARRPRRAGARLVAFYFDLCSPWTYLAAERAERLFGGERWRPAAGDALRGGRAAPDLRGERVRIAAERRAAELRLPLVWPERWPGPGRRAMRVAALAAEQGRAAPFAVAAGRLAFCGGFDLDDPEVIAEAAAAAGLPLADALRAAGDLGRDGGMDRAALRLRRAGADELPAAVVRGCVFAGERRLAEAAAAAAAPPAPGRRIARPG